ncbi:hypothetical protein R6Y90_19085 [Alteromonas macleodii]|uniref:hypothetical protein n=1 Tax=Alteromonas macleodii TaxID=28108 RepID=UPI0029826E58|nr:hypothetical protein [Alteromonas macleodii]MDW5287056.1 hypothetical protein [Alteromonas macleodii]
MIATYDFNDAVGSQCISPTSHQSYDSSDVNFLPLRVDVNEQQIYVFLKHRKFEIALPESDGNLKIPDCVSVEDCVAHSQAILGLKIHEIAKILGISRAALDLHRKGKVKDIHPYYELYRFAKKIEIKFGYSIAPLMRSVMVDRKTLVQHIIANRSNLENTLQYFDLIAKQNHNIQVTKAPLAPEKTSKRFAKIGRRI